MSKKKDSKTKHPCYVFNVKAKRHFINGVLVSSSFRGTSLAWIFCHPLPQIVNNQSMCQETSDANQSTARELGLLSHYAVLVMTPAWSPVSQ